MACSIAAMRIVIFLPALAVASHRSIVMSALLTDCGRYGKYQVKSGSPSVVPAANRLGYVLYHFRTVRFFASNVLSRNNR